MNSLKNNNLKRKRKEPGRTKFPWDNIIENISDYVMIFNREYEIEYANQSVFNLNLNNITGKNILKIFNRENSLLMKRAIDFVFITGKAEAIEINIAKNIEKPKKWLSCRLSAIETNGSVEQVVCFSTDITEKRYLIEEKYKTLFGNIHDYIYDIEYENNQIISSFHSAKSEEITGYLPNEFIDNQNLWFEMVYHEDKNKVLSFVNDFQNKNEMKSTEHRIVHKNGSIRWVLNTTANQINSQGEFIRKTGFLTDITEKKFIEKELKEAVLTMETILNSVDAGVAFSIDNKFFWVNRHFEKMFGYETGELIYKSIEIIFPDKKDYESPLFAEYSLLKNQRFFSNHMIMKKKGGSLFLAEYRTRMVNKNDISKGVISFIEDITEKTRMLIALYESEERYKTLFNGAAEGILVMDIESRKFQYVNPAICRMLGYDKEELLHLKISDIFSKETVEPILPKLKTFLKNESIFLNNLTCWRKDGASIYTDISAARVRINRKPFIVYIFKDITERKQAEEKIKASLKEKEILLSEIHHRVKNNLAVVSSLLGLQAEHINDERLKRSLLDGQSRIDSMSIIYETLYLSEDISCIDMKSYLSNLIHAVSQNYSVGSHINLIIESENILLEVKQA
ncbi:MAG: PAS domain S-box protein, partial [Spirochaetia bacterium]|nr:PAS domain S-box protein [Spirochaetia bacterium]